MKHEFYLLNDVLYIKQQNVNLLSGLRCIYDLNNACHTSSTTTTALSPPHGIDMRIPAKLIK
jgi:hypothetical protein